MAYLDTSGLTTLWAKIKSFSRANYLQRDNVGKYLKLAVAGYSYSSPMISISSDTNWHTLNLITDSRAVIEGDLLAAELFSASPSSVFTCNTPGVYAIDATALFCGNTSGVTGWIHINHGTYSGVKHVGTDYWYPPSSGNHSAVDASVSATFTLDEGDTVSFEVARGAGGAMYVTGAFVSITCLADLSDPNRFAKTITDLHIAPRSAWNAGTTPALSSSNAEYACGVETVNEYVYTDRNNKTFYLMPVDSRASKVTITIKDAALTNYKISIVGYKKVNGTLTRIFQTGYTTSLSYSWLAGDIDFVTVHVQNVAGTSFAWDYSPSNISIKFTNY